MNSKVALSSFRIHNDAAGYRAGLESITRNALTPGDTRHCREVLQRQL